MSKHEFLLPAVWRLMGHKDIGTTVGISHDVLDRPQVDDAIVLPGLPGEVTSAPRGSR